MTQSEENLYWDRGSEKDIYETILLTPKIRHSDFDQSHMTPGS